MLCKKQFTVLSYMKTHNNPICDICGCKMYVYMRDDSKGIIRYRCSDYPKCKKYTIRRLK